MINKIELAHMGGTLSFTALLFVTEEGISSHALSSACLSLLESCSQLTVQRGMITSGLPGLVLGPLHGS